MKTNLITGWKMMKVEDLAVRISAGGTPRRDKQEYWKNGSINWLKISDLKSMYIDKTEEKITKLGQENSSAKLFPKGTVVYSIFATLGAVGILNMEATTNQAIVGIVPKKELILDQFLYYCLKAERNKLLAKKSHTTQDNLNLTILKNHEIPVPSLSVQKQIVYILREIEQIKKIRTEAIELTKDFLKGLFLEMFADGITKHSDHVSLESITIRITDGEHITPRRVERGIYLLSARNVLNHSITLEDVDFIDENEYTRISKRIKPQKGDVLVSCSGSIGRAARVKDSYKFQLVRSVALIRPDVEKLNSIYLEYFFGTDYMQKQILKSVNQSNQANLFQGQIKKLQIYLPPLDMQNKFASIVENIEITQEYQIESKKHIDHLFSILMYRAFNGEFVC